MGILQDTSDVLCDGCSVGGIGKTDKVSALQEEIEVVKDRAGSRTAVGLGYI
jgi:hypothetical protein